MFRHIWPSSSVKILVLRKLLCSFGLTWPSFMCGPIYVPVYPSVMGHCPCVACVLMRLLSTLDDGHIVRNM
jgi:hypothetical protein